MSKDGTIQQSWIPSTAYYRVQELLSMDKLLIWRGWCNEQTELGEARPDTLLFLEIDSTWHLRQAGQRLFRKAQGFIESIAANPVTRSLVVVLGNSAGGIREIRTGSFEDFVGNLENAMAIDWVPYHVDSVVFGEESNLFLLSSDGSIYCTDVITFDRKAILSPSVSFRMLSTSRLPQETLLIADNQSNLFLCQMENIK
jgi:hypothetical protein